MKTRIYTLLLGVCALGCKEGLAGIDVVVNEPDPPVPVYELKIFLAGATEVPRAYPRGMEGEPIEFPAQVSWGFAVDGIIDQVCALARGEDDLLLGALSDPVRRVAGETREVSLTLAVIDDDEVPPECAAGLLDAGPPTM